ncbi:MAG: TolC family protein [Acidobacteriota bacterium]
MSKRNRALSLVLSGFLASVHLLAAQGESGQIRMPQGSLTLSEAVELALNNNPMIRASAAGVDVAAAGVSEARAGRLPVLRFNEKYTNSNNPVYVFGSLLEQGRFAANNFDVNFLNNPGSMSNFRSSLNLEIPLFNRFKVQSGIEQAQIQQAQSQTQSDWVRQQLRLHVVQAYFGLLVAQQREQVAAEAVRTAESEVSNIQSKVEQGLAVRSDLLAMQVQLAEFRQQQVEAAGDAQTALAALNTVLALPVATPLQLGATLEDRDFRIPEQTELISTALSRRPDYLNAARQVELAEQQVRVARGSWWPDLNLFAQAGQSSQNLTNGSGDFAVGASLNFDVVDFGRPARIEQAVARTRAARAEQDRMANQVRLEVVQALQGYLTSKQRLELTAAAVDQATEAQRIVQDRLDVGLTTVTEVLRAQTALLRAQLNQLGARYQHYLGYAQVLLASGSLNDVGPFSN